MKKKKTHVKNGIAKDLRTPKYKMRVVADKRKKADAVTWKKMMERVLRDALREAFGD